LLPGIRFIKVEVSKPVLLKRFMVRDKVFQAKLNLTHEQIWNLDNDACKAMREKYGAYSEDNYMKMINESFYAM